MLTRSFQSLLGVLFGFACVFPLLRKRETKTPTNTSELLLHKAQSQMREAQAKNQERAVQAITQKNNLQALADQTQKMVNQLAEKAEASEAALDMKTTRELLTERDKYQETLVSVQTSLASAIVTTEVVKTAMRREENQIRAMTAEALAMKAQERQAQIEIALAKARLAQTTNLATDLFVQAREKIRLTKAQRDLIVQIAQTVETLDTAAQEADAAGNEPLSQKLAASRDALRDSALNAALWKA